MKVPSSLQQGCAQLQQNTTFALAIFYPIYTYIIMTLLSYRPLTFPDLFFSSRLSLLLNVISKFSLITHSSSLGQGRRSQCSL